MSVSFPNLKSVEKSAKISYNQPGSITKISFPALQTIGALEIVNNPGLVEVEHPRLLTINNVEYGAYTQSKSFLGVAALAFAPLTALKKP